MSIVEDDNDHDGEDILDDSDDEVVKELEALGYGPQEGQIVRSEVQPISRNKKIDKILENPDVSEVHVSYKKSGLTGRRQPYVCILFRNGSSIERPLADLGSNEEPHCGPIPEGQIEPQSHYRKPRLITGGRMRRGRGGIGDWFRRTSGNFSRSEVQRFTDENGCTVVFKKLIMRKCKDRHEHDDHHDHGGHYHHDHDDCGCGHQYKKRRGFFS